MVKRGNPKTEPAFKTKSEDPCESSDLERKKETADVELSGQALIAARFSRVAMLLRKPRKRNAAGFF